MSKGACTALRLIIRKIFYIIVIIIVITIIIIIIIMIIFPQSFFFFSPFSFFTSSKRFSRQLHQVERKLGEIRNMAKTLDCFCCFIIRSQFLLMYLLKHLLFQLDYRAAANEVEALKEENDLLRRKYVFPQIVACSLKNFFLN